ncbi:MAG: hypothetical protein K2Q26_14140 [Bdellovibrionales bacterium]|nr:hypothetical protein [Bdellovibrionales bacterium]
MNSLSYFYVFLQSNLLEVPFYFMIYKEVRRLKLIRIHHDLWDFFFLVTLSNMMTHPIVFFVIMSAKISFLSGILVAEGFAIFAETLLHHFVFKIPLKYTFTASTLANLVSWQLGPMITYALFY